MPFSYCLAVVSSYHKQIFAKIWASVGQVQERACEANAEGDLCSFTYDCQRSFRNPLLKMEK